MSNSYSSDGVIPLPPGVSVSAGRETVQTGANGQAIQGMIYTLTLPKAAQTSVFVPYTLMNNTALVSHMFAERIAAINNVTGLSG